MLLENQTRNRVDFLYDPALVQKIGTGSGVCWSALCCCWHGLKASEAWRYLQLLFLDKRIGAPYRLRGSFAIHLPEKAGDLHYWMILNFERTQ